MVKTKDGQEFSEYLEYPKGDPREPMTMEDLRSKFSGNAAGLLDEKRQKEVEEAIFACDELSCADLMQKFVV